MNKNRKKQYKEQNKQQDHLQVVPTSSFWSTFFIGFIFFAIGAVMLFISGYLYHKHQKFIALAVPAQGVVIDLIRSESSDKKDRKIMYSPVVQFIDAQNISQTFNTNSASNPPSYRRGEKVKVLYDPLNPEFAIIDDWMVYLPMLVTGIIGTIVTFIFLCGIVCKIKELKQAANSGNQKITSKNK